MKTLKITETTLLNHEEIYGLCFSLQKELFSDKSENYTITIVKDSSPFFTADYNNVQTAVINFQGFKAAILMMIEQQKQLLKASSLCNNNPLPNAVYIQLHNIIQEDTSNEVYSYT